MVMYNAAKELAQELEGRELELGNGSQVPGPGFDHIWTHWRGDESIDYVMPAILSLADLLKDRTKITFYPIIGNKWLIEDSVCVNMIEVKGLITYSVLVGK